MYLLESGRFPSFQYAGCNICYYEISSLTLSGSFVNGSGRAEDCSGKGDPLTWGGFR